jgi:predicted RNA-binding protein with PIN domain
MQYLVDGNNVMGATIRGWWNDPSAAAEKLATTVAMWCRDHGNDRVTVVFDGAPQEGVQRQAGGNLAVDFAPRPGRNAADDRIVELVQELFIDPDLTVVTSDKGLIARLPPGVLLMGAGQYGRLVGQV